MKKTASKLQLEDFAESPVWEFTGDEIDNDFVVSPVYENPVSNMYGRFVGVRVFLANGAQCSCIVSALGNLAKNDVLSNALFVLIIGEDRVPVYSYNHPLSQTFGPNNLAEKLGLDSDKVFPFRFDLSRSLNCNNPKLVGDWDGREVFDPDEMLVRALNTAEDEITFGSRVKK